MGIVAPSNLPAGHHQGGVQRRAGFEQFDDQSIQLRFRLPLDIVGRQNDSPAPRTIPGLREELRCRAHRIEKAISTPTRLAAEELRSERRFDFAQVTGHGQGGIRARVAS